MEIRVVDESKLKHTIERCRERGVIIPTFAQQKDPSLVPERIKESIKGLGLWDVDSRNLFRITWKNDVETGLFGGVNYIELPPSLTGVKARILALLGKFFPTGAHKVGATFGCLVPSLVTGRFDPTTQKAVWPSTGNYCRGGAYDSHLLGCESVAILPEEMSRERFEWLEKIGAEIFATPGCESNVKEIYDKCWELKAERGDSIVIFNQFSEFGNGMWHYEITGSAIAEVLEGEMKPRDRFFAYCVATGSAGTLAAGDYLKKLHPTSKIVASEALQCPTLLINGFGGHRIEGIGDKHVPWIHNVRNTDMVVAVDDEDCMSLMRLFNEPEGRSYLVEEAGVPQNVVERLDLVGISGICNLLTCVKVAKYYELTERDILFTVFTDSMELYESRMDEARRRYGPYSRTRAAVDYHRRLLGQGIDHMLELGYYERKRIHNLKYYTWIEQQKMNVEELNAQWYDWPEYWEERFGAASRYDEFIEEFNRKVGLIAG